MYFESSEINRFSFKLNQNHSKRYEFVNKSSIFASFKKNKPKKSLDKIDLKSFGHYLMSYAQSRLAI